MKTATKFAVLGLALGALSIGTPGWAAEYFIESDDFKEGEEIVNVFLKADDYQLMVEDIERNGEAFDWGWVKTPGAVEQPAEEAGKGKKMMKRLRRGGPNPAEPKELGFQLGSYKTVAIPKVENHSGLISPNAQDTVRESFVLAMKEAGLTVVAEGKPADLELKLAIVDYKRDSTYIYVGTVQPFIELEMRLRDTAKGENLMLLRSQSHSNTPEDASLNYASTLLKFLR
jgi:hypothetical protein